jgi:toxin ParE1/3/4
LKLVWQPTARAQRAAIFDYIASESARAACMVDDRLDEQTAQLPVYPTSGRPGRVPGTRELVVTGRPYILVYRIEPGVVRIIRLLHGAQRWPPRA